MERTHQDTKTRSHLDNMSLVRAEVAIECARADSEPKANATQLSLVAGGDLAARTHLYVCIRVCMYVCVFVCV